MKKILILAVTAIASLFLSSSIMRADNNSICRVYGYEGLVVSIDQPTTRAYAIGTPTHYQFNFTVSLNKTAPEDIGVVVEIYDLNGTFLRNATVYIPKGQRSTSPVLRVDVSRETIVNIRLASASCK